MYIKNSKTTGITLIELIITLGIVSIVLLLTFSMSSFANTTFNKGSTKSNVQSTLRNTTNYITKQLRYSSNIEVLSDMPATPDPNKEYIYADASGSIKHYSSGATTTVAASSGGLVTNLEFKQQDYQTVYFKLNSTLKGESFSIDTSVIALNIGDKVIKGADTGAVISFTAGQDFTLGTNIKPVTAINITASSNTVLSGGGTLQLSSTVQPSDASIQAVTWSLDPSSASYAAINAASGLLTTTTTTPGVVIKVKATANDGSGVWATYDVTTTALSVPMSSFSISSPSNYVSNNGGKLNMTISNVSPSNATDQSVTWSIDKDSSIATIDVATGILTAFSVNSTTVRVTAAAKNNAAVKAIKDITIIPKINTINITGGNYINDKNASLQLNCSISPVIPESQRTIVWSVSGDSDASISNTGLLESGRGNKGRISANTLVVTVIITTKDGLSYRTTKNITVSH